MQASIIIPCYNEAAIIRSTIRRLNEYKATHPDTEIIIVDDGSEDDTLEIISEHDTLFITQTETEHKVDRLISYKPNRGKGYAIRQGIMAAKHSTIILLDADLSVRPDEINNALPFMNGNPIMLIGNRVQVTPQPSYRIFAGKLFKMLVFAKTKMWQDTQCPFKILKDIPKHTLQYKTDGFAFDVELIKLVKDAGIPIIEHNVAYYNRRDSKVTWKKAIKMFWEILSI